MSYGLVYTLPFASRDGRAYEVRIEREGYTGESRELKGQTSPFTVTIDSEEFIYTPTRFSTATLAIFGGDYLQDLFSTDYRMHRVTLYADGVAVWCGFIKPEMYTQDYSSIKFNLEVNCYSAMSVLEFVEYKQAGEERGFVSLWSLLKKCIEESKGQYSAVYLPHVYGLSQSDYNSWNNPLESMMVSEQNFFDEDDNAMSLLEVLEEIMKLMNWTCVDWRGELYFVDVNNEIGEYYRYTADMSSYTQIQADEMNVQDIGFAGSDHTLDVLPGYNKASVRCSNYPAGEALPDLSFDKMNYVWKFTRNDSVYIKTSYVFKPQTFYTLSSYEEKTENGDFEWREISEDEQRDIMKRWEEEGVNYFSFNVGCYPEKYERLKSEDIENHTIVDHELTERYRVNTVNWIRNYGEGKDILKIEGVSTVYYNDALYINFDVVIPSRFSKFSFDKEHRYDFRFRLRVGDMYFHLSENGEYKWDNNSEFDDTYTNMVWLNNEPISSDSDMYDNAYAPKFKTRTVSRQLDDGFEDASGIVCKFPRDKIVSGKLELSLIAPKIRVRLEDLSGWEDISTIFIEDVNIGISHYTSFDMNNKEDDNSDRIYENIVNENYLNELDEIEFKISSYNDDGACYSKVTINNSYLTNNLYCGIVGENIRPEEFLIRRIVDHYSVPKIKLTQVLKRAEIKPYTVLSDKYSVNKKYINAGGEIDYRKNRFNCIMIEI